MSSTALVYARHASATLSNRVPFSYFFITGNRRESQGERSDEYDECGSSCTSLSLRKSTDAAVCVLALSCWRKRPQCPVFGWRWYQTLKTFGRQWCTVMPVRSDCASVLQKNGGDMARFSEETRNKFLLCTAWSLQFWGWGLFRKQPDRWLHLGVRVISISPRFVTCQPFPGQFWSVPVELSQHELAPLNPNPSLFVRQRMGGPPCTSFSDTEMIVQYGPGRCRSDAKTFLNLSGGNPCFHPDYFFSASIFVTITVVADVPHRCSSSKLRLRRLNSPHQKKNWVLDGAFLPKSCFKLSMHFSWCKPFI